MDNGKFSKDNQNKVIESAKNISKIREMVLVNQKMKVILLNFITTRKKENKKNLKNNRIKLKKISIKQINYLP